MYMMKNTIPYKAIPKKTKTFSLVRFLTSFAIFFFITGFAIGFEVDEEELRQHADKSVEFTNYYGPHETIDSREDIINIGRFLGSTEEEGGFTRSYAGKYTVIHAVSPSTNKRMDADIFILAETALVDHIRNLRWIIYGFLEEYYDYSAEDAKLLAEFITYYNAVLRDDVGFVVEKYKPLVIENLEEDKIGLSRTYKKWAGQSMLLIPLTEKAGNRAFGSLDSDELSEEKVIEDLRKQEDRGVEPRKNIVELKEREIEAEREEIEEEKEAVASEEEALEEKKEELEERKEQLEQREVQLAQLERQQTEEQTESPSEETAPTEEPEQTPETSTPIQDQTEQTETAEASEQEGDEVTEEQPGPETDVSEREDVEVVRAEIEREREEIAQEEEEVAEQEAELEQRRQEVAEREEEQQERVEQISEERDQIAQDQQELITEASMERTVETEEDVSETVPFIVFSSREDVFYGSYVYADKRSGDIVKSSSLDTIVTRNIVSLGDFFIAIAENGQEFNIVQLDKETLSPVLASEEIVFRDGHLLVENGSIYTPVQQGGGWVLGKFDRELTLRATSEEQVAPQTFLLHSDDAVFTQNEDGKVISLRASDLSKR